MKRISLLALFSLFIFIACETFISFQLYSSDLFSYSNNANSSLFINAKLKIEASDEDLADAEEFLKENFRESKNFRIESGEFNDYIIADYKIPIVHEKNYVQNDLDLFVLVIKPLDENNFELGLNFNYNKFEYLNEYVSNEFYSSIDLEDTQISFDFQNDMENKVLSTWKSVYIDGKAVPIESSNTLVKREAQNIRLSEVFLNSFSENEGIIYFGKISLIK